MSLMELNEEKIGEIGRVNSNVDANNLSMVHHHQHVCLIINPLPTAYAAILMTQACLLEWYIALQFEASYDMHRLELNLFVEVVTGKS